MPMFDLNLEVSKTLTKGENLKFESCVYLKQVLSIFNFFLV